MSMGSAQIPVPMPDTTSTIAGSGAAGSPVSGTLAVSNPIWMISGVAVDQFGNVFIADQAGNQVYKVSAKTGLITVAAGNGESAKFGANGTWGEGGPAMQAICPSSLGCSSRRVRQSVHLRHTQQHRAQGRWINRRDFDGCRIYLWRNNRGYTACSKCFTTTAHRDQCRF